MRDLAPTIFRQRSLVEGKPASTIDGHQIKAYLNDLADVLAMTALIPAVTHKSETFGWAGWVHWETSGAHFYAWDAPSPFFSVDVYTCKPFDTADLIDFTFKFFDCRDLVHLEVK